MVPGQAQSPTDIDRAPRGGSWLQWSMFALIALSVASVSLAGPHHERLLPLQLVWGLGSLAWLIAFRSASKPSTTWIVLGAIILRCLALAGDPALSDDAYRYVWEGGLVAEGANPYRYAPDAPELSEFRERWSEIHAGVNHRDVSAAYPPLTQWAHAAVTTLAGGPGEPARSLFAMRLFFGAMDLLCLIPLALLLRGSRHRAGSLLAWAWSPLISLEFAGSAHFDSLGILALLCALACFRRNFERAHTAHSAHSAKLGTLALLVAGALVKLIPVLLIPFVARGKRFFFSLLGAGVVFAVAWLPFVSNGAGDLFAGLSEYGTRWEAGSLVFRWIERPLALCLARDGSFTDPRHVARLGVGLLFIAIYLREWRRPPDLCRTAGVLIGSFLVLSPTLHPWYLAWVVPFVALRPSRAWSVLLVTAPLLYWPLAGWHTIGVWREPDWLWPVLALPFFGLLIVDAIRARTGARSSTLGR